MKHAIKRLQCLIMRHHFNLDDMGHRDKSGYLRWSCFKCGKEFIVPCGLDILDHGLIVRLPVEGNK